MIFGKLICRFLGHKRGRVIDKSPTHRTTACPRCGARRTYAVRAKAAA